MATPLPRFIVEFVNGNARILERLVEGPGCDPIEVRLSELGRLEAGMEVPAVDLLREIELSKFAVRSNKRAVVTQLPTWYWVTVVGDNGEMRGKPHLVRHTLPGPNYGPARFELWGEVVNPGTEWWRMRYFLRRAEHKAHDNCACYATCVECGRTVPDGCNCQ